MSLKKSFVAAMSIQKKIDQMERVLRELRQLDREISLELHEKRKLASKLSRVELTNKQAAALLGVPERTLTNMKRDGRIRSMSAIDILNNK